MITKDELFLIGSTHKPHGLHGEINCSFIHTMFDDAEAPYFVLEIDNIMVPFFLESYRFKTDTTALVKFEGVDTEKTALDLTEKPIYLPIVYQAYANEENITMQALVGFEAIDMKVGSLGIITEVNESTQNILFVVNDGDLILPAHDEFVETVDYEQKKIFLHIPQELLNL